MNLLGFRYFLEVARTLNFSEASRHLHVSQPGLSQQISSLEKELGFKLLKRTTRRVTLTDEGAFLYENLKPSFNKIENTIEEIATLKKKYLKQSFTSLPYRLLLTFGYQVS